MESPLAPPSDSEKRPAERRTLSERVTSAMFWNSVLLPVKTVLAFGSSVVVVRSLSQTDYAIFGLVIAMLTTLGTYSDLGIENSLQKFLPEVERRFGRDGIVRFMAALLAFKFALLALVFVGMYAYWNEAVSCTFNSAVAPLRISSRSSFCSYLASFPTLASNSF